MIELRFDMPADLPPAHRALIGSARSALLEAVRAVTPSALLARCVHLDPSAGRLVIDADRRIEVDLRACQRRFLLAIGKVAPAFVEAALHHFPRGWFHAVWCLGAQAAEIPGAHVWAGDHPVPGRRSLQATSELLRAIGAARPGADDLVLAFVSGGGSALLCAPVQPLTLDDLAEVNRALLGSGLAIEEINAVRSHLSQVKGGGLARRLAPARVVALVLCDTPDPHTVASGPFSPSRRSAAEVLRMCRELCLPLPEAAWAALERRARSERQDAPRTPPRTHVCIVSVGDAQTAHRALDHALVRVGFAVTPQRERLAGEARDVGRMLAAALRSTASRGGRKALTAAGETTVTAPGPGVGGRCQELVLAAAQALAGATQPALLVAAGTDGCDFVPDVAGGYVTEATAQRCRSLGIDLDEALARHDSFAVLSRLRQHVYLTPHQTNVNDLVVALTAPGA